jgi:predicted lactoylglutathione lyase
MESAQNNILVEFHVPDFELVKEYYGKLGFEVAWERAPEDSKGYLVLTMGNNILCFWCGNERVYKQSYFKKYPKDTKRGYGVEVVVSIDNIESYYVRVSEFANVVQELIVRPWGLKDFRTEDPFGYYLRFTSLHNILDERYAVK